jgi:hypothetical protein
MAAVLALAVVLVALLAVRRPQGAAAVLPDTAWLLWLGGLGGVLGVSDGAGPELRCILAACVPHQHRPHSSGVIRTKRTPMRTDPSCLLNPADRRVQCPHP